MLSPTPTPRSGAVRVIIVSPLSTDSLDEDETEAEGAELTEEEVSLFTQAVSGSANATSESGIITAAKVFFIVKSLFFG